MGFHLCGEQFDLWITEQKKTHDIYAPKRFVGGSTFSDVDCIRYGKVSSISEIVFDQKSEYSFKEVLTPISQTLFFFTEDQCKEADPPKKGAVIFLRSCDLHALKRLDDMYLGNGPADYYYKRIRDNIKLVLIGCRQSFESCFCVSMGTNISENYDMSVNAAGSTYEINCKDAAWNQFFLDLNASRHLVVPDQVHENPTVVKIPENLTIDVARSSMWEQYNRRCINCGRCNFVCPTCTCFTMQDLYYTENAKVGERRRVWASCMVDGFTDVAGGGSCRRKNGERMRFKVLHKVLDYKQRHGYHMCVGCGRCDDICPEYISFSHCVNKLEDAMKEVTE